MMERTIEPAGTVSLPDATYLSRLSQIQEAISKSSVSTRVFAAALVLGIGLRLLAVIWGDIGPGGDGAERISYAVAWAHHPYWKGLSGVWPYTHFYFLGILIRLFGNPVLLAKLVNFGFGVGAILALRRAVRPTFGELPASLASLMLAIFWTHIWLTSAYWVELPFMLFIILAVSFALQTQETQDPKSAVCCGLFLTLGLLLRHEGIPLIGLVGLWAVIKVRKPRLVFLMMLLPALLLAWYFIEPQLSGHSYFEYASFVRQAKEGENLVQGVSFKDCIIRWVVIPAGLPSIFIVIPGLYGLWLRRRTAVTELFAWMFVSLVAFYFVMSLRYSWQPQVRYIMLYFFNLLPYSAVGWLEIIKKFKLKMRWAIPALVALTILTQGAAWWVGRNQRRHLGWLPVEIESSSQKALDNWFEGVTKNLSQHTSVVAILPGPTDDPWSLTHSEIESAPRSNLLEARNLYVPEVKSVLTGDLPDYAYTADLIVIYRKALFYRTVVNALTSRGRTFQATDIHPDVTVFRMNPVQTTQ